MVIDNSWFKVQGSRLKV